MSFLRSLYAHTCSKESFKAAFHGIFFMVFMQVSNNGYIDLASVFNRTCDFFGNEPNLGSNSPFLYIHQIRTHKAELNIV